MDCFPSKKPAGIVWTRLLSLLVLVLFVFCGCGSSRRKSKGPDPVSVAEKTKPELAVSEKDTSTSEDSSSGTGGTGGALSVDYILVEVAKEPITYGEVLKATERKLERLKAVDVSREEKEQVFSMTLQAMVTEKLILHEAKEEGYNVSEARVLSHLRGEVPEISEKFGGDVEKYVEAKGLDYEKLIEKTRKSLIYRAYLQYNVFTKINITPAEVRKYYQENKDEFTEKAGIHVFAITMYKKGDEVENAKVLQKAGDIKMQLDNGEDFEKLAKENTEDPEKREKGGDWGWIGKDHFDIKEELSRAVSELPVGKHSDVIETKVAYWIIKVAGRKAESESQIVDVWEDIEKKIRTGKVNDEVAATVGRLQKKYRVVMHRAPVLREED